MYEVMQNSHKKEYLRDTELLTITEAQHSNYLKVIQKLFSKNTDSVEVLS